MKICPKCDVLKDFNDFYKHKSHKDGLQTYCKECWNSYTSSEERKVKRRKYNLNSKMSERRREYHRSWRLMRKYGITVEQYAGMLEIQKQRCAICETHQVDCHNGLYVDHDHKTKKVRQLLCRDCNVGIGHFKEDPAVLEKAIRYLNRHKKKFLIVKGEK